MPQTFKIVETYTDMTIHWNTFEDHFLNFSRKRQSLKTFRPAPTAPSIVKRPNRSPTRPFAISLASRGSEKLAPYSDFPVLSTPIPGVSGKERTGNSFCPLPPPTLGISPLAMCDHCFISPNTPGARRQGSPRMCRFPLLTKVFKLKHTRYHQHQITHQHHGT
jgi:hypothetical protein